MPVTNAYCTATKYRLTLELDVNDDFNPRQINWEKVFELQENESVECYIEELDQHSVTIRGDVQSVLLMNTQSNTQIMSQTFAIFLLECANNGNEILAVLDDIVETTDTVL